jgi:hypothetical protein
MGGNGKKVPRMFNGMWSEINKCSVCWSLIGESECSTSEYVVYLLVVFVFQSLPNRYNFTSDGDRVIDLV